MIRIIFLLLTISSSVIAQEHIFLVPDNEPKCGLMKIGRFKNPKNNIKDYYMVVGNGIQTEYVSNGKYYVKSKMEFINECEYKTTIIEVTIPNFKMKPGEFITTKIIETECDFIKIKSTMEGKDYINVFEKLE